MIFIKLANLSKEHLPEIGINCPQIVSHLLNSPQMEAIVGDRRYNKIGAYSPNVTGTKDKRQIRSKSVLELFVFGLQVIEKEHSGFGCAKIRSWTIEEDDEVQKSYNIPPSMKT